MARRAKPKRRRKDTRFNLLGFVETAVFGNIITEAAFGTSLFGFFTEGAGEPGTSLKDLFADPKNRVEDVTKRLQDPQVLLDAALKGIGAAWSFKLFNKALAMPKRKVNMGLKQLGLPVKV